jgi:hypothetical protein
MEEINFALKDSSNQNISMVIHQNGCWGVSSANLVIYQPTVHEAYWWLQKKKARQTHQMPRLILRNV